MNLAGRIADRSIGGYDLHEYPGLTASTSSWLALERGLSLFRTSEAPPYFRRLACLSQAWNSTEYLHASRVQVRRIYKKHFWSLH